MKKEFLFGMLVVIILITALPVFAGQEPQLWLYAGKNWGDGDGAGCLIGNPSSTMVTGDPTVNHIAIYDWQNPGQKNRVSQPMPAPGTIQQWQAYLWTDPSYTQDQMYLRWGVGYTPSSLRWTISVYRNAGGGVFENMYASFGIDPTNVGFLTLPAIKTENWRDGWIILVNANNTSSVPEPGSLLALGSGLVGLVGFGLLRRR